MKVGVMFTMINTAGDSRKDESIYRDELAVAELVEPMGFDMILTVEHHFTGYAICPNTCQLLSYFAGRTKRIELVSALIILPWHDPIRVAEEIAVLDVLSGGRTIFGFGRGSAPVEYQGMRIPMEESRERFKEAAEIVIKGLSCDRFSYQGRIFNVPETSIRPRPISHPERRLYGAAVSPDSAEIMAKLGLGVMVIAQKDWDMTKSDVDNYRHYAAEAGFKIRPSFCVPGPVCIAEDSQEAWDLAYTYAAAGLKEITRHYGHAEGSLQGVKSYEFHNRIARTFKKVSNESEAQKKALDFFLDRWIVGNPKEALEKLEYVQSRVEADRFAFDFSFAGVPLGRVQRSMQLFAEKVLPVLKNDPAFTPKCEA